MSTTLPLFPGRPFVGLPDTATILDARRAGACEDRVWLRVIDGTAVAELLVLPGTSGMLPVDPAPNAPSNGMRVLLARADRPLPTSDTDESGVYVGMGAQDALRRLEQAGALVLTPTRVFPAYQHVQAARLATADSARNRMAASARVIIALAITTTPHAAVEWPAALGDRLHVTLDNTGTLSHDTLRECARFLGTYWGQEPHILLLFDDASWPLMDTLVTALSAYRDTNHDQRLRRTTPTGDLTLYHAFTDALHRLAPWPIVEGA